MVIVSFIFYIWYFISTLLLPLKEFINLPEGIYLSLYRLMDFPLSILSFILCISIISTVIVLVQFKEQKKWMKKFLIGGLSFTLYFIIPIIATVFLVILISLQNSGTTFIEAQITQFVQDVFLFTTTLFILTAILNIATEKILTLGNCCPSQEQEPNQ